MYVRWPALAGVVEGKCNASSEHVKVLVSRVYIGTSLSLSLSLSSGDHCNEPFRFSGDEALRH